MLNKLHITAVLACGLAASCGGGGGSSPQSPTLTPTPTPTPTPDPWSEVEAAIEAFVVEDVAIVIGDASGALFRFERGNVNVDTSLESASSAKLLTGLTLISLMEEGALSLSTGPADVLAFWTADDQRSETTLQQLLSFTSGFNARPLELGCWTLGGIELQTCAQRIYIDGLDTDPGAAFSYGPEHLQVAAAMAESVAGAPFIDVFRQQVADPLNLTPSFRFATPSTTNPRAGGGAIVNAADYALLLQAVLAGQVVNDLDAYIGDFTQGAQILNSPATDQGRDWRYGLGYWVECGLAVYDDACAETPTISSPGAFGFTPWIDFEHQYYGVIAIEEAIVDGQTGGEVSTALEQELQPLIEAALSEIR